MNNPNYEMNKMHKRLFLIFFISALLMLINIFNVDAATSEVSKIRIRKIAGIIRRYTNANEKLSDPYVKEAIFDEVNKDYTLEPEEKPNEKSIKEIAKDVRKKVGKRFPNSIKTIKAKTIAEADKKFKMAEKLDFVTIRVQKGRNSYAVTGIFYGHGIGGKSVRIGDNVPIAFFDLLPQSRAMFDKAFAESEKNSYIDEKVRNYYRKKGNYANILFAEIRKKITSENEKLGYIYAWDKWRTPKNVTTYLIEQISNKLGEVKVADKGNEGKGEKKQEEPDTGNEENNDPLNDKPLTTDPGKSDKLQLAKLIRSIEERQLEIAGSQYGIDADQGFHRKGKRVLWGMSQENVNLIFKDQIPQNSQAAVETITFQKGPYKSIKFHFINGFFFRVEAIYAIGPMEAMMMLWENLNDKYGEAEESKKMRETENARKARIAAIKNPCQPDPKTKKETHKWHKSGKCTACKMAKADLHPPPPSLEQIFTWKGAITKGVLKIKLNPARNQFTEFYFSKEDTNIKATQEALIAAERKRKAEEDKQKKLEEYRKSLE
jgi:hypothetical protein